MYCERYFIHRGDTYQFLKILIKEITYLSFQLLSRYASLYMSGQIVLINPEDSILLQRKKKVSFP